MTEILSTLDPFFKALASDTRQRILFHVFADGHERTVGQVAELAGMGQSTVSEHLAVLKRGGLLESRREGKEVYYRPDRAKIVATLRNLTDLLANCCTNE